MHIVRPGGSQLISSRLQKSVMRTLWLPMGEPGAPQGAPAQPWELKMSSETSKMSSEN